MTMMTPYDVIGWERVNAEMGRRFTSVCALKILVPTSAMCDAVACMIFG